MDRVERHDLINAVALAAVLLAMALALVWGARALFRAVDGTVTSDKGEEVVAGEDGSDGETTSTTGTEAAEETASTTAVAHVQSEVIVRVGNGARIKGVAGSGTSMIEQAGFRSASPKNAPATETSIVYYIEGYQADAVSVARILGIAATQVAPMPADPGVPQGEAHIVVILGADTTVSGG